MKKNHHIKTLNTTGPKYGGKQATFEVRLNYESSLWLDSLFCCLWAGLGDVIGLTPPPRRGPTWIRRQHQRPYCSARPCVVGPFPGQPGSVTTWRSCTRRRQRGTRSAWSRFCCTVHVTPMTETSTGATRPPCTGQRRKVADRGHLYPPDTPAGLEQQWRHSGSLICLWRKRPGTVSLLWAYLSG